MMNLGPCCACGKKDGTVRNLLMLPYKAPAPGSGWGCVVCHLPPDGASAIVCDQCLRNKVPLKDVIVGQATEGKRAPIDSVNSGLVHEHDELYHPELIEERIQREREEGKSR
jgi:hypothetical protein